jgi:tetratricopeptide (TPR) repeat protein
MSMADRLKQSNNFASKPSYTTSQSKKTDDTAWDGLDDFISGPPLQRKTVSTSKPEEKSKNGTSDDLWGFDSAGNATDDGKRKKSPQTAKVKADKSSTAFDFSEFEDPGASQSSALGGQVHSSQSRREQKKAANSINLFDDEDEVDDSVLGSLGRPTRPLASAHREGQRESAVRPDKVPARSGAKSPPPHIVGQVVEMGFSPLQAREALLATDDGQDVGAAIEMLLQSTNAEKERRGQSGRDDDEERDRRYALRVQQEENARRRTKSAGDTHRSDRTPNGDSRSGTPTDWQKQADQLYVQASEIGASVFSKANALWASAKTQAQKALEEHNASTANSSSNVSSGRSSPATGSDRARNRRWAVPSRDGGAARRDWQGKPKWMIDAEQEADDEQRQSEATPAVVKEAASQFKDDVDVDVQGAPAFISKSRATAQPEARAHTPSPRYQSPALRQSRAEADLWGTAVDAERPSRPVEQVSKQAKTPTARAPQAVAKATRTAAPGAPTLKSRVLTQDNSGDVQTSVKFRQRGNEHFKRGAYGEAEAAYTLALDALSANQRSLRRVAVLNNRANARIKNGDAKGALDDTLSVLRIIVVQENDRSSPFLLYRPSHEAPLPSPEYAEINLREAYAKALLRRAQAEEQLERWDPALSVWSLLERYEREEGSGANGVSNLRAAQDGKGRCNKMLKGGAVDVNEDATQSRPVINPGVRKAASRAVAKAEAQAKERIRTENAAAAAEEATKDSLRDTVDARISTWKTGKENNVRALLASLHDVVWPGLAWKKVGMHELVMDNQVKKCYMRAIGKLHPDKLTPRNNTVEERMIGGAVFSVLNEAYASANV